MVSWVFTLSTFWPLMLICPLVVSTDITLTAFGTSDVIAPFCRLIVSALEVIVERMYTFATALAPQYCAVFS